MVNFCTAESKKTTSQDAPSAGLAIATSATIGDDGSSGKGCGHSLFSFLENCVLGCIREERGDPLLPGGPQVARAILLAVHAEVTTSTM